MKIDYPMDGGKTEPGAPFLGGKKRKKYFVQGFFLNPLPGVLKKDLDDLSASFAGTDAAATG